jgi:hypothetical protein
VAGRSIHPNRLCVDTCVEEYNVVHGPKLATRYTIGKLLWLLFPGRQVDQTRNRPCFGRPKLLQSILRLVLDVSYGSPNFQIILDGPAECPVLRISPVAHVLIHRLSRLA